MSHACAVPDTSSLADDQFAVFVEIGIATRALESRRRETSGDSAKGSAHDRRGSGRPLSSWHIGMRPLEASDHCERYEVSRCSENPT